MPAHLPRQQCYWCPFLEICWSSLAAELAVATGSERFGKRHSVHMSHRSWPPLLAKGLLPTLWSAPGPQELAAKVGEEYCYDAPYKSRRMRPSRPSSDNLLS